MLFEPPAQAAEEVQLAILRLPVRRRVLAGKGVVAGPVQPGIVQRHRVGVRGKVACVKVDHIGQHRLRAVPRRGRSAVRGRCASRRTGRTGIRRCSSSGSRSRETVAITALTAGTGRLRQRRRGRRYGCGLHVRERPATPSGASRMTSRKPQARWWHKGRRRSRPRPRPDDSDRGPLPKAGGLAVQKGSDAGVTHVRSACGRRQGRRSGGPMQESLGERRWRGGAVDGGLKAAVQAGRTCAAARQPERPRR